jgi:hypothetical protein
MFSVYANPLTSFVTAISAGILIELWDAQKLGTYPLLLLFIALVLNLYKRKFNPGHLIFLLPFSLLCVVIYLFIHNNMSFKNIVITEQLLSSGAGIIALWSLVYLWRRFILKDRLV